MDSTYEARIYAGNVSAPIAVKAFTPSCGTASPSPTPGESINARRLVFTDIDGRTCEMPDAAAWLASLPKTGRYGTIYEGSVKRCEVEACAEAMRSRFCVGVPSAVEQAPDCETAVKRAEAYAGLYWFYCTLLRVCGR